MEQSHHISAGRQPRRHHLQGSRPSPLKVSKPSHTIKKAHLHPPHHQSQHSSAAAATAASSFDELAWPTIIYDVSPKVIHVQESDFRSIVQRLTGLSTDTSTAATTPAAVELLSPAARLASIERTCPTERETSAAALSDDDYDFMLLEDLEPQQQHHHKYQSPTASSSDELPKPITINTVSPIHVQEDKDMLLLSDRGKLVDRLKQIILNEESFGNQKLASIQIPMAKETIKRKSRSILFEDPVEKIWDFTFSEPKEVKFIKGKSSSPLFSSKRKSPDFTFLEPKAEPPAEKSSSTPFDSKRKVLVIEPKAECIEGKSSSTFFGSGINVPDSTFIEPKSVESIGGKSTSTYPDSEVESPDTTLSDLKGVESIEEKSSSSSGGSYDVVLDFDNRQHNAKVLILSERLSTCLKTFEIHVSTPNVVALEVGLTGKVFIPVFSKGFASNESCLWNLVSMEDCRSYSATNHIIPIFFGIKPSDLRLDTPLYQQGLDKLRRNVDDIAINRWTEALVDVSNISGQFIIPETAGLDEIAYFMSEICQMILHKLRLSLLSKCTYLVGMNRHVENITDMLNLGVNNVEAIVIAGKEGAGKTTLARAAYDKLSSSFEGCSFLTAIDGAWHPNCGAIRTSQTQLVSDLLKREVEVIQSVDEGIDIIRERFCNMKVLIVLDGVRNYFQVERLVGKLNWFGPGTRFIITTRSTNLIIPFDHSIYDISSHRLRLSDEEVFDLFKRHAFPKSYPFANFDTLWKEHPKAIIRRHDFCLLDIEIVGSLLYGKSKAEWESMFLHLKQEGGFKCLDEVLRMSYESLTEKQKEMFLDVACLPDGIDRRIVLLLSHDYLHSQPSHDLEVLIGLSLVKIDADDEVWMHYLVRNFGEGIITKSMNLGRDKTDLIDLGAMRLFKITYVKVGPFDMYTARQRGIFYASQFPTLVPVDHHVKSLKVLDLSRSKITEKWETWHQIKAPQLRVLNLTGCIDLMITPNFSFCPNLEMLILEHCSQLVKIDPSIQGLQRLATLNLRYCVELSVLPKEIGCLNSLKELLLDGTSIQEIPITIGHLKKLQILTAINCSSLTQLPSSTCNLLCITSLRLDCAKIAELPCSILQKMKLQYLSLRDCRHITKLGSFAGEVERSLVELDVSGTSITELPKSISKLKILRVLKVEFCFIREFPLGFGRLKKLEEVHASWCKKLENLPHDIAGIESLRILKVGHSRISSLPQGIQLLEHLEFLDCTSCNNLQGLPELPSTLISLHVQSKELEGFHDLQNFVSLKEFTLGSDACITSSFDRQKLSQSLRTLALCLPHTKKLPGFPICLRELTLQCANLKHIPSLPSTLVSISIKNSRLLRKLPSIRKLENLREMEVVCCPEIKKISGLERLRALQVLTVSDCGIEQLNGLDKLFSMKRLTLQDCRSLSKLPTVERLDNLWEMKIKGCSRIERIVGFGRLQSLEVLSISNCGVRSLDGLDKLSSLRRLTIADCGSLHQVPDLSNLRNLDEKCVLLEDLE